MSVSACPTMVLRCAGVRAPAVARKSGGVNRERWSAGEVVWQVGSDGPLHPFDFAC